jgi:uncharacterized damage-inducible protein DinB
MEEKVHLRISVLTIFGLAGATFALSAQTPNPVVSEARAAYDQVKTNIVRMAEKMPAADYDYKPVPEVRTFGGLMAHIADAQTRFCSTVNGQAKTPDASSKKTKEEIVAALKASVAECDAAWDATNDANAFTMMSAGRGQRSRLGILMAYTVVHDNEEYGYGAMYLRSKGIVPPSSDNAGRGGK